MFFGSKPRSVLKPCSRSFKSQRSARATASKQAPQALQAMQAMQALTSATASYDFTHSRRAKPLSRCLGRGDGFRLSIRPFREPVRKIIATALIRTSLCRLYVHDLHDPCLVPQLDQQSWNFGIAALNPEIEALKPLDFAAATLDTREPCKSLHTMT